MWSGLWGQKRRKRAASGCGCGVAPSCARAHGAQCMGGRTGARVSAHLLWQPLFEIAAPPLTYFYRGVGTVKHG